jgi:branched-subunit amino acid aminotransferase/4-amino-4-deoxychorismate lyase
VTIDRPPLPTPTLDRHTVRMESPLAYKNGEWLKDSELSIAVDDLGFLLGATITERLRTFRGQVFQLETHLKRMRHSLEIVGLDGGRIVAELSAAIPEFVARNSAAIAPEDDWTINAFVTPGVAGSRRPTICVHGWPLRFGEWAEIYQKGLPVVVSDVRQVPDSCWPSELKCRSRMHYYLAELHAAKREPGARALLLDEDGYVAESTTANFLLYRENEGLSSPPDEHILVGISLGVVQKLAGALGVPWMRRRISVEELHQADEMMLTSTSVCLLPVVRCDGTPVADGAPGPIFRQLLAAWSKMVGVDIAIQARQFAAR